MVDISGVSNLSAATSTNEGTSSTDPCPTCKLLFTYIIVIFVVVVAHLMVFSPFSLQTFTFL